MAAGWNCTRVITTRKTESRCDKKQIAIQCSHYFRPFLGVLPRFPPLLRSLSSSLHPSSSRPSPEPPSFPPPLPPNPSTPFPQDPRRRLSAGASSEVKSEEEGQAGGGLEAKHEQAGGGPEAGKQEDASVGAPAAAAVGAGEGGGGAAGAPTVKEEGATAMEVDGSVPGQALPPHAAAAAVVPVVGKEQMAAAAATAAACSYTGRL